MYSYTVIEDGYAIVYYGRDDHPTFAATIDDIIKIRPVRIYITEHDIVMAVPSITKPWLETVRVTVSHYEYNNARWDDKDKILAQAARTLKDELINYINRWELNE